jgi:carboxylesterase type B
MKQLYYVHFLLIALFYTLTGCAVKTSKGITYSSEYNLQLDVYAPKKGEALKPVYIFIHGGS